MRRAALLLASLTLLLAASALLISGCGGDDEEAPAAQPAERFGPEAVDGMVAVEEIRARLVPVTVLVALGRRDAAGHQLREARALWEQLAPGIERDDPVLAREVNVAFDRVHRALERGGTFDAVRDVAGPLRTQLLAGVREELVEKQARLDKGVNAATLDRMLIALERVYAAGDRASIEHAFGIVDRSQALAREVAGQLGPERAAVVDGLKELRKRGWPEGLTAPEEQAPAAEIAERVADIRAALARRFDLAP